MNGDGCWRNKDGSEHTPEVGVSMEDALQLNAEYDSGYMRGVAAEDATPRGKLLAHARMAKKRLDRAWTLAMRTETPEAWAAVDAAQMEHARVEHEIARIVGNA